MVNKFDTDGDTVFQCEQCGRTFDERNEAEAHEDNCFVPPSM